jgi:hypothetical protein
VPRHTMELGVYIALPAEEQTTGESNNQHFYHYLNVRGHGYFEKCIIDTHPDHQRGDSGGVEISNNPQTPSGSLTYFDMLTRFYIDWPGFAITGTYEMAGFRFYQETNAEDVVNIRAIHGGYIPNTGNIEVKWTVPQNIATARNCEVRYAFSSIHVLGWNNAITPANPTVADTGDHGYNALKWVGSGINVAGRTSIFVAVRLIGQTGFRQIELPIYSG